MSYTEFMVACMIQVKRFYCEADYNFYNHLTPGLGDSSSSSSSSDTVQGASFFFGARIWLGIILCRFSINYFSGLGLKIRVRVSVRVRVMVKVLVRVRVRVGVTVSVVIWSV